MQNTTFDQNFCNVLEYHLSRALTNSTNTGLNGFWCDGVLMPDDLQLTRLNIIEKRHVLTRTWVGWLGNTKQELFNMRIVLGECSLNNLLNGQDIKDCLPDENITNWIEINEVDKFVQINLK